MVLYGKLWISGSSEMKKGWIEEIMSDGPGLERRLYRLTAAGEDALKTEIGRLRRMLRGAEEE